MKILVTGGAGYKGSVLSKMLLDNDHDVVVLDTLRWGAWPVMQLIARPKYTFVKGDVRDAAVVAKCMSKVDVVINLAGVVGHPDCDRWPREAQQSNVDAVEKMCLLFNRDQKFIQASTGSVYGKLEEVCTEESPTNPLSLYGKTKLQAEYFVGRVGGVNLRFATAFGTSPCMRFDVVPSFFTWKALTERCMVVYEGHARRTIINVWDMCRAYLFAIEHYGQMSGRVWNVGDESLNVTKRQIVDQIQALIFKEESLNVPIFGEATMKDKDARDYEVSYKRINELGFKCVIGLEQGLQETYRAAKVVIGVDPNPWRLN